MTLATTDPFNLLTEWAAPPTRDALERYYWDPVGFAENCIEWPEGMGLTEYQKEALAEVAKSRRVCIRSMHGAGKTTFVAIVILWFVLTRDSTGKSWKLPVTAGAWRQLEKFLWPEIHLWAARLRWDVIGRKRFNRGELMRLTLRLDNGEAFAVASDNPALIEGTHAECVMYVFDESKSIASGTFDAAEGAFSNEGAEGIEAFAIATSTPGELIGRFWEIQTAKAGLEDWKPLHWTLERVMAAGRVTQKWVDQRAKLWGEKSAAFANRVLGEFLSDAADGVIPLAWVEAAMERWRAKLDIHDQLKSDVVLGSLDSVGVDVARYGEDKSALALRYGVRVHELREFHHIDTMETTGMVGGVLTANPGAKAVIDTDGLGAGVTDRARELGFDVLAFHGGEKTDLKDRSKELGFLNRRAAAWWRLREALDPRFDSQVELPDDAELLGDLTAPKWKVTSNSRIQLESKEELKKRLGRSPDKGDAVVQSFWEERERRRAKMHYRPVDRRTQASMAEAS